MECPGEDPHLSSVYAEMYVKGFQAYGHASGLKKGITTPKHFTGQLFEGDGSNPWGNGTTVNRQSNDTRYTMRDLEQYYLPAFKAAMITAEAGSVMCAYQGVNGVPMCANGFILNHIVRNTWGWKGFVVSDCDALNTMMVASEPGGNSNFGHAYSLNGAMAAQDGTRAGCDSGCSGVYTGFGMQAVAEGLITEKELNASVRRLGAASIRARAVRPRHLAAVGALQLVARGHTSTPAACTRGSTAVHRPPSEPTLRHLAWTRAAARPWRQSSRCGCASFPTPTAPPFLSYVFCFGVSVVGVSA